MALRLNARAAAALHSCRQAPHDADTHLARDLRDLADGGVEARGDVVVWPGGATWAESPPGRYGDLTGWECSVNSIHLEDAVPVTVTVNGDGEPSISEADQLLLLRQGIALGEALCRTAAEARPPMPLRCLVGVNATAGTFRFHRIRPGEDWLLPDLDGYVSEMIAVIDSRA